MIYILCPRKSPQPPFQGGAGSLLYIRSTGAADLLYARVYSSPLKRELSQKAKVGLSTRGFMEKKVLKTCISRVSFIIAKYHNQSQMIKDRRDASDS